MKEEILKLRSQGKSYSEIQKELGCSPGTISYHCNEKSKEKAKLRSKNRKRKKCICGEFIKKESTICMKCSAEEYKKKRDKIYESSIEDYLQHHNKTTKNANIRRLARVFMEETKIEKKCQICGFNEYVEVCHIKPIKDFNKNDKINDVNSLKNLVYLCPNHHKLLDLGKIKL